ncbi:MAG: ribosomal-protein-alanine N-acetyltransferase [Ruminococcaceae bacterium]|nr:ribosomal-protein-alanine N-acetyltransferase [Oscillospiraceae bacterium]
MIRAAISEDANEIATLFFRSMPAPWRASAVEDAIHSPTSVVWLWEENGKILGALILQVCLDEAEILTIATAKEARRRGIGRSLIAYALKEIGREVSVFLEVRSENKAAIAFYKTLGFSVYGMRKRYYRDPPDDALLMKFGKF